MILVNLIISPIFDYELWTKIPKQFDLKHKMIFTFPFAVQYFLRQDLVLDRLKDVFKDKSQELVVYNIRNYFDYQSGNLNNLRK